MMLSEDRSQIRKMTSSKIICFEDNAKYPSLYSLVVPVYINNQRISLGIEVVDTEVPLLLSKSTLSKMKANIDLATNKYKLFGKEVKTYESTSGHTMISLLKQDVAEVFLTQEEKRLSKKEIEKLHRQFGHCKGEKLNKLLSTQRFYDKDLEKAVFDVTDNCDTCKKYGRAKPNLLLVFLKRIFLMDASVWTCTSYQFSEKQRGICIFWTSSLGFRWHKLSTQR